jgi:hypothetical protein
VWAKEQKAKEIRQQGKLYPGYAYWQLLHVYYAVNWIMDRKIPDFNFQYRKEIIFRDMQRVQNKEPAVFKKDYFNIFWTYRNDYKNYLQQLHNSFMTSLLSVNEEVREKLSGIEKIAIIFDDKKGIYRQDNKDLCYEIEYGSERQKLISYLFPKDRASLFDIETDTNREGKSELIMKEIRKINSLFRTKLDVNEDLIFSIPTGGYCLNKDKFDIRMNPKDL